MDKLFSRIDKLERARTEHRLIVINRPVVRPCDPFAGFRVVWPSGEAQEYIGASRGVLKLRIASDARKLKLSGIVIIQCFEISEG